MLDCHGRRPPSSSLAHILSAPFFLLHACAHRRMSPPVSTRRRLSPILPEPSHHRDAQRRLLFLAEQPSPSLVPPTPTGTDAELPPLPIFFPIAGQPPLMPEVFRMPLPSFLACPSPLPPLGTIDVCPSHHHRTNPLPPFISLDTTVPHGHRPRPSRHRPCCPLLVRATIIVSATPHQPETVLRSRSIAGHCSHSKPPSSSPSCCCSPIHHGRHLPHHRRPHLSLPFSDRLLPTLPPPCSNLCWHALI